MCIRDSLSSDEALIFIAGSLLDSGFLEACVQHLVPLDNGDPLTLPRRSVDNSAAQNLCRSSRWKITVESKIARLQSLTGRPSRQQRAGRKIFGREYEANIEVKLRL